MPPAQLLHDGAPLGDELGVGLQPGGTLLLTAAELPGLLARLVSQHDRGRKLRPLDPGGLQFAHALFPLGMPLGGTLGLVAAVTWRLVHRRVQAVTFGPKLPGGHGPQVH
jgi:hypothetical protein